jgi:hypothetical protein
LIDLWHDYVRHDGVYPDNQVKPWETKVNLRERFCSVLEKYLRYSSVVVVAHAEIFASLVPINEILHCSVLEYEL